MNFIQVYIFRNFIKCNEVLIRLQSTIPTYKLFNFPLFVGGFVKNLLGTDCFFDIVSKSLFFSENWLKKYLNNIHRLPTSVVSNL